MSAASITKYFGKKLSENGQLNHIDQKYKMELNVIYHQCALQSGTHYSLEDNHGREINCKSWCKQKRVSSFQSSEMNHGKIADRDRGNIKRDQTGQKLRPEISLVGRVRFHRREDDALRVFILKGT